MYKRWFCLMLSSLMPQLWEAPSLLLPRLSTLLTFTGAKSQADNVNLFLKACFWGNPN